MLSAKPESALRSNTNDAGSALSSDENATSAFSFSVNPRRSVPRSAATDVPESSQVRRV